VQGPEPQSIASRKQALRSTLRAQRATLAPPPGSADATALSQAVADHVDAELRTAGARSVALYAAHREELDPRPIAERARARGCAVSYPRVALRTPPTLSFHLCSETELAPGYAGLPEPGAAAPSSPALDAIVVPGLGFDRRGARLGYGKGFYDAALREQPAALRIAVGYDFQLVPTIPSGEQDEPVDLVITPSGRWRTGARPLPAPPATKESL
jgi:5-formyltetrahydrofolate cyclo-ligase